MYMQSKENGGASLDASKSTINSLLRDNDEPTLNVVVCKDVPRAAT